MKAIFILSVICCLVMPSCEHEKEAVYYEPRFEQYRPIVLRESSRVPRMVSDSLQTIISTYLQDVAVYSCTDCIARVPAFEPLKSFVSRHPESLVIVLDNALKDFRLTWGFRELFKAFYPTNYQRLFDEAGIVIPDKDGEDWFHNTMEENSLPFEDLVNEYLVIIGARSR